MKIFRTLFFQAAFALLLLSFLFPTATATAEQTPATPSPQTMEQQFVDLINQLRSSLGLTTLAVDSELTAACRNHAQVMANAGDIFHAQDLSVGVTANWGKLGENVGVGGNVQQLFDAFVASPGHYHNLVDPAFNEIGVGVVVTNRIFTCHRFMKVLPPQSSPAPSTNQPSGGNPVATNPTPTEEAAALKEFFEEQAAAKEAAAEQAQEYEERAAAEQAEETARAAAQAEALRAAATPPANPAQVAAIIASLSFL